MRKFSLSGVALAATLASSLRFAHPARYVIEDGPALVILKAQGRTEGVAQNITIDTESTKQGNVFATRRALESSMSGEDTDANTKYEESNHTLAAAKDDIAASSARRLYNRSVDSPDASTEKQPTATPKMPPARASTPKHEALANLLERKKKKRPSLFTEVSARTTANFERIMKRGGR